MICSYARLLGWQQWLSSARLPLPLWLAKPKSGSRETSQKKKPPAAPASMICVSCWIWHLACVPAETLTACICASSCWM